MNEYLERARACIEAAVSGMDAAALRRHRPGKWSSAEILEHLSRAFTSTSKLMGKHLERGRPTTKDSTWVQRWRVLMVITLGYLPTGIAAPEFTMPRGIAAAEALDTFRQALAGMDDAITNCEQRFEPGAKIAAHVFFGPLSAAQWRRFHWVHTRHHARQIQQLRDLAGDAWLALTPQSRTRAEN